MFLLCAAFWGASAAPGESSAIAATGTDTLMCYCESTGNSPRSRAWNGVSWGAPVTMPSVGARPRWMVARSSVAGWNAFATLDENKDVNAGFLTAGVWSPVTEAATDATTSNDRCFDLACESQSGDALLVYWTKGPKKVGYRTGNGTAWSSESLLTLPSDKQARYLALFPNPDSDSTLLLAMNDKNDIFSSWWSGSSWSPVTTLELDAHTDTNESFAAAYEGLTGRLLVIYSVRNRNAPQYRTWNGASWSSESSPPALPDEARWMCLASDPNSNTLLFAAVDKKKHLTVNAWDGSAWGPNVEIEDDAKYTDRRDFGLAFEPGGAGAVLVHSRKNDSTLHYRTWTEAGWSADLLGPDLGSQPQTVQVRAGRAGSEVFIAATNADHEVWLVRWNGSVMSSPVLATAAAASSLTAESFMIAPASSGNWTPPHVVRWAEVEPR